MADGAFGPANSSLTGTPTLWMPMVKISIAHPQSGTILENDLTALVDTGSDFCRIDDDLLKKHPEIQSFGETPSIDATGTTKSKVYQFQLLFDNKRFLMFCLTASLRSQGSLFDLLFGMDAIRFFDLTVSRSRQEVSLKWAGS